MKYMICNLKKCLVHFKVKVYLNLDRFQSCGGPMLDDP